MRHDVAFDAGLITRYDKLGPRYTSYPTAVQFTPAFGWTDYDEACARSRQGSPATPLSVYAHIPFCTSPCFYCACTRIITRRPEMAAAYLRRLRREIELQGQLFGRRRTVEQLHFGGGTPTYLDAAQMTELMAALDEHLALSRGDTREFSIEADPRTIDAAAVGRLAALGFNRLSLGVQDFDPAVQAAVNRVQSVEDTVHLVEAARNTGYRSVSVDLIYGLPLQTPASFARTLDQIVAMRPDRVAAYSYAHLPQQFKAQRQIETAQLPTPATKLELLRLTIEKLTGAGYAYIGMDHFALPGDELAVALRNGTLHRNFQGYSTRGGLDLIGLGLSAIGKVADTYSQNAKTLHGYYAPLDEHRLPVERGLRLNRDDLIRRAIIEDVMCRGYVDIGQVEAHHRVSFADDFAGALARLRPLADDGLVEMDAAGIRVTPRGRLLLRVVAMAFDAYHGRADTAPRFSKVI